MTKLVTLQATGSIESKKRIKEFYEVNAMPEVVGIRFKSCGKIYDFEVNGVDVNKGDFVIAESEFGLTIGSVIMERHAVEAPERELKKVIRKATEEDLLQQQENLKLEAEAKDYCIERIMARGLPMKPVSTEVTLDRKRIIIYFTAEKRIDFRELVKDLAAKFKTRIEMRQIGVRDEAKVLGGIGICGRELCCARFLTFFEPISIKMAKRQELILNTGKLSGLCGRLMCCLGYEYNEASPEDVALTETEADSSLPEDAEMFEIVVASGEPSEEANEAEAQPHGTETQQPLQPKEQEHRESFRKSPGRRRKHRKRPHKK
jgi:cell fate regulator YaaT (PSP1 superfamily)